MWAFLLLTGASLAADDTLKRMCDGLVAPEQLECIAHNYKDDYDAVEAACAAPDVASRKACRVARYAERGIVFVGRPDKAEGDGGPRREGEPKIDADALKGVGIALGLAGATLQLVPSVCALAKNCKLSESDSALILAFSGVVTEAGVQVPAILATNAPDVDKASRLLRLAERLEASVPTGLSDEAQGMISASLQTLRGALPTLFSLAPKKDG